MIKGLFLIIGLATSLAAARLETSIDPREIRVGDPLTLTVSMSLEPGESALPFKFPSSLDPFEVIRSSSTGNVHTLTLTTFDIDIATIPAIGFPYQNAKGTTQLLESPEIPVTIRSVLPPNAKGLKGLKGRLASLPWNPAPWVGGLLIGAAMVGLFFWWRSRRKGPGITAGPPPLPPDEEAFRALNELEPLLDGPAKPYYTRLTDALRLYIERRFRLPALDRTTTELIPLLRTFPISIDLRAALKELLETADLAKFARFESPTDERQRHRDRARELVRETTRLVEGKEETP